MVDFSLKLNFLQFLNKTILESAQQIKEIDVDYYVINHQWFRVAYIVLCNLQNSNWPHLNWLGLTWNLKLCILQIKFAFDQQNKKMTHFAFIVAYFSAWIGHVYSVYLTEYNRAIITVIIINV